MDDVGIVGNAQESGSNWMCGVAAPENQPSKLDYLQAAGLRSYLLSRTERDETRIYVLGQSASEFKWIAFATAE